MSSFGKFVLSTMLLMSSVGNDIVLASQSGAEFVDPKGPIEWWQTGVIYQVYPRSFKDSDGDGIGDLKGIEEKAEYFKDLGVSGVWLSPIFKSPMVDFGYDISDFKNIAEEFGTIEDFASLKSKLHSLGIKLILDFVPNHSSDQHEWFKKSIKKINPYTDYYVWTDPKGWKDNKPIPPSNWINIFGTSAWTYNEERKQFYLHQFAVQQPDFNYRCKELLDEITDILTFWMNEGADGFRIDAVPHLVEDIEFRDEPEDKSYVKKSGKSDLVEYESLMHIYTKDQPETFDIMKLFQKTIIDYSRDFKSRFMVTEASTSVNTTMKYYLGSDGAESNMPFNFVLAKFVNSDSKAQDFVNGIHLWMDNMPKGKWPNWFSSSHDLTRTATKYGDALADAINMLILLLPGTAFIYNGEELGMQDTNIRWDQSVDPAGLTVGPEHYNKFSRDPERTPFQWDSTVSAGFSKNRTTWLPVNENYWYLNLENQKKSERSHYHVFKRLVHLRSTSPTIQRGKFIVRALSNYVLILIREMKDYPTFVVIINLDSEEVTINLENIHEIPSVMTVHTSSINSEYKIGDVVSVFKMRPKSSLVLTSSEADTLTTDEISSPKSIATLPYFSVFIQLLSVILLFAGTVA